MKKIFGIAILSVLMACNQAEKKSDDKIDSSTVNTADKKNTVVIEDVKKAKIFTDYVLLKDALVKSDAAEAQKLASGLQKSLADYEGCETTASIAEKIAATNNLKFQRKDFTALSMDLIAFIKSTPLKGGKIYVQHCPMANKGDGGDWLSTEKEIKNPYYGNEMLECGRVTEEIKGI
ncbi:DUF3347 domain-containing protein [Pedobacter aquatilis]|uniref:DUF3347 domain-containing protein n=1 Tax=Pedobacter aquatilis TaxID=351343 RepID=UPI00292FB2DE|nr:DUF3347 domain-containing protein [Pedobacter aquatilis]